MAIKPNPVNFVLAQNAAVVLHAAKVDEMLVRGLQGMGLCLGFTMETQTIQEMGRRIALVVPSGGTYEETSINYNFIPGDPSMEEFRNAALNSTKLIDVRLYVKQGCDFSAPDLISDPASGLYVGSFSDPSVDSPNAVFTGTLSYMPGGAFVLFIAHKGGTTLSYVSSTRIITDTDNSLVAQGFEVDDIIMVDYFETDMPPVIGQIEAVDAGTITLADGLGNIANMSDWSGVAATAIHAATPMVVTGYDLESCD